MRNGVWNELRDKLLLILAEEGIVPPDDGDSSSDEGEANVDVTAKTSHAVSITNLKLREWRVKVRLDGSEIIIP